MEVGSVILYQECLLLFSCTQFVQYIHLLTYMYVHEQVHVHVCITCTCTCTCICTYMYLLNSCGSCGSVKLWLSPQLSLFLSLSLKPESVINIQRMDYTHLHVHCCITYMCATIVHVHCIYPSPIGVQQGVHVLLGIPLSPSCISLSSRISLLLYVTTARIL